jgi:hypothetical protein
MSTTIWVRSSMPTLKCLWFKTHSYGWEFHCQSVKSTICTNVQHFFFLKVLSGIFFTIKNVFELN